MELKESEIILPQNESYILNFEIEENYNVYNPTAPFQYKDKTIILARVENIKQWCSYVSPFYPDENNIWKKISWSLENLELEDPFITKIGDELIFVAVYVFPHKSRGGNLKFQTVFYRGKDLFNLKEFARGPLQMKDIRLIELQDGRIGIFTRPTGGEFLKGRIGYLEINKLEDLNEKILTQAEIIKLPIKDDQWVGSNNIYLLDENKIGVLGHLAFQDKEGLHYSAITFIFNPKNFQINNFKIIAQRKDFPAGPTKSKETKDVVFPGGLIIQESRFVLYAGLSDASVGVIKIDNPWLENT